MDKRQLFEVLKKQNSADLLSLLQAAYDELNASQRRRVFGEFAQRSKPSTVEGQKLLKEIRKFHKESFDGVYYAPFNINSKNWTHIPEETEEWFDRVGALLEASAKLTEQGEHSKAVECFNLLFELIEAMESGDEIVFADEYGSWMISGDEKKCVKAYISSLAATTSPEEFVAATTPLIKRDSHQSFYTKAYTAALSVANKEQRAHLQEEIKRQNIRVPDKTKK
jgi:curved DNA-binding protein CbpA